jgi:tRNA dimethylallyltransferase
MPPSDPRKPLLAIVGPTAVGKSALAVDLARKLDGEVVNADSRQVYRGMEIGTAVPSPDELAAAPHHLYGIVTPDQGFSLARFLALATETIEGIHARGRLPILVGGTGQYVWALLKGWRAPSVPPDSQLRRELEAEAERDGPEALHRRLGVVDPTAAARIDPRNVRRTVRALEVHHATGVPFSLAGRRATPPYRTLVLGLTTPIRAELHARIDARVDAMMVSGWLDEVRRLLDRGHSADLPALSSVGYRELSRHLAGEMGLEEAVRGVKAGHRQLVRRQHTWFKRDDGRIRWIVVGEGAASEAETLVRGLIGREG